MEDPIVVGIRWGLYLTLSVAFGVPLFALSALEPLRRSALPLRALVGLSAAAALMLSFLGWVAMTAAMADKPLTNVAREDLMAMLAMPGLGTSWLLRLAALVVLVLVASFAGLRRALPVMGTVLGAVALGSLAWSGHGAAGDGFIGRLHLAADVVHLLAAGAWVGALFALLFLLRQAVRDAAVIGVAHAALAGFGRTGTIIVAAIIGTGLINSWVLVGPGRVFALPSTLWGQFLLVKLGLFTGMLGLAAHNRRKLTPDLERELKAGSSVSMTRLQRSVLFESGAGVLILGLVAWLGTLSAPAT